MMTELFVPPWWPAATATKVEPLPLLGARCLVFRCSNREGEGHFVGSFCAPCHAFITTGEGRHSQAYRNALDTAEAILAEARREEQG